MFRKNIIVGVTGGIAAYKTATIIRLLKKEGWNIKVIMTELAKKFITPLTLSTLSKNPVLVEFFDPENGQWNSHVDLATWADAYLIAPATANTIAKMAHGIADNLLLTTYLSSRSVVFFAPAMDLDMYHHKATQQNIEILKQRGNISIDPASGELASGLIGKGRMQEPEIIVETVKKYFCRVSILENKNILITAGPTQEMIDPVRFISNYSSGKMGFALAQYAAELGANVTLVAGPTSVKPPQDFHILLLNVTSAEEMYNVTKQHFEDADIIIFAAAVADYTSVIKSQTKNKKNTDILTIELKKTIDIAKTLSLTKQPNQITIGFALETDNEIEYATKKLQEKNLDFIVLNSLNTTGAGFKHDTNQIVIIDKNSAEQFPLKPKDEVAKDIFSKIFTLLRK